MLWGWEAVIALPTKKPVSPHQRYAMETGRLRVDSCESCPPRDDSLRGPQFGHPYDDHYDCDFNDSNNAAKCVHAN